MRMCEEGDLIYIPMDGDSTCSTDLPSFFLVWTDEEICACEMNEFEFRNKKFLLLPFVNFH